MAIRGELPYFRADTNSVQNIISIVSWGDIEWKFLNYAFRGATELRTIETTKAPNLSSIQSLLGLFYGATQFNADLSQWDTSTVTNLWQTFYKAENFNGNISTWDVSNITIMWGTFWSAKAFNQDLSQWDTSQVKYMSYMFNDASSFAGHDLSNWDVSSVQVRSKFDYGWGIGNTSPDFPY